MQPSTYKHTAGYKSLITYVLYQALSDLTSPTPKVRELAKEFLLSEDGKHYCEAIGFNYSLIRHIDFDNPKNSLKYI